MTASTMAPSTNRYAMDLSGLGMVLIIASEAVLFSLLIASYFYIRSSQPEWPPAGIEPPRLLVPLINTALLLSSSGTAFWAERHAGRSRGMMRLGLVLTIALGATFLGLQLFEYSRETLDSGATAYGSLFYTITGFHGFHVLAGLFMATYVLGLSFAGRLGPRSHAVRNFSWYWHFVDIVWLFILSSVYFYPHLAGGA